MPLFDTSRLARCTSVDMLRDEMMAILQAANTEGLRGPIKVRCQQDEPALFIEMPNADLTEIPPIQIRSGRQIWEIPAWPSTHNPTPIAGISGSPAITEYPNPPPHGQSFEGIDETTGISTPNPIEEDFWQLPLTLQGTVVSGAAGSYVIDVFLADPAAGVAWRRMNATDRSAGSALSPGDPVTVSLYFPADGNGQVVAYVA